MAGGGDTRSGGSECLKAQTKVWIESSFPIRCWWTLATLPLSLLISPSLILQPSHNSLSFPISSHNFYFSLGYLELVPMLCSQES